MEQYLAPLPLNAFIHLYEPDNPLASAPRDAEAVRAWLNGEPRAPSFSQVYDDLTRMIRLKDHFRTLDAGVEFEAEVDAGERPISILTSEGGFLISESLLSEVWHYLRAAGYSLPHNFPGGLEARAPYLIALFSELPYLHPVWVSETDDERQIGLQYIAPVDAA